MAPQEGYPKYLLQKEMTKFNSPTLIDKKDKKSPKKLHLNIKHLSEEFEYFRYG